MNEDIMNWTETCARCNTSNEETDMEQVSGILNAASELEAATVMESKGLKNGRCYYHTKHEKEAVKCKTIFLAQRPDGNQKLPGLWLAAPEKWFSKVESSLDDKEKFDCVVETLDVDKRKELPAVMLFPPEVETEYETIKAAMLAAKQGKREDSYTPKELLKLLSKLRHEDRLGKSDRQLRQHPTQQWQK